MRKLTKPQYARDFSELAETDRLALVAAMVRVGISASAKVRSKNLKEAGRSALTEGEKR